MQYARQNLCEHIVNQNKTIERTEISGENIYL